MLYKTNNNNNKTGHNAEQDNVCGIVNSYIATETANILLLKQQQDNVYEQCTQQHNVYEVASSVLYTAAQCL